MSAESLGFIGGALTTFCYVPQLVRVLKLRSARELSLPFMVSLLAGIALWLVYGVRAELLPVILWNAISLTLVSILVCMKLKYGK